MSGYLTGKQILVTGGTGFIGSAVIKQFLSHGAVIRILDNNSRGALSKLGEAASQIEFMEGDIRDPETVRKAVKGMDSVCHLAYINGTEFFYTKPELILEVAVKGMMNILDACLKENVRELVLASSSEVYQTPPATPTGETVPLVVPDVLNPRFSYGGGKIISELLAINYGRKFFDRVLIFRPHNVYGPDMGKEHVIPQFALRMNELIRQHPEGGIDFPIQGSGKETRSFIYIEDFTRALLRVMEVGHHLDIFHIGTDREVSIENLAQIVSRSYSREIRIIPGERLKGSTTRRCPDVSKLRSIGFHPLVSLEEGVRGTVEWYQGCYS